MIEVLTQKPLRGALVAAVLTLAPRTALACSVCFGQSDSPLALGINYGIFLMLGIIVVLWAAFGSFFIYLRRRARMLEAADRLADPGPTMAGVRHPQGGMI